MAVEDIIQKIIAQTGLNNDEVQKRILEKQQELSGLISQEGAAYIIAKEIGLDLLKSGRKPLEIKSVVPGIKNLNLIARISRTFQPKQFEREGIHQVANIVLLDKTGSIRLSLWDKQVELLKNLEVGAAVEISDAYTREDYKGEPEIRLGRRGRIKPLEQTELPPLEEMQRVTEPKEICISKMLEGGTYEVRAALVQVFETNPFYEICPTCGARVKEPDFKCSEHGSVSPAYAMIVSGVIDDGSSNIRAVFFRDAAEKLINLKTEQARQQKATLFENLDIVGKEFIFSGKVRRNQMFDRVEFIVSDIKDVDVRGKANEIINSFGSNV